MTIPTYVTDTHVLLWWIQNSPRLSARCQRIFEEADVGNAFLIIPVIVLAELGRIIEKGKFDLDFTLLLSAIINHPFYVIAPLELAHIQCAFSHLNVSELHDRFITCEAKLRDVPLITVDANIIASGEVLTIQ